MGVFHVFKIVQMVPNRETHHIFGITSTYEIISYHIQDTRKRETNWKNTRRKRMSLKKKYIKAKLKPRVSKYQYFKYHFSWFLFPKQLGSAKNKFFETKFIAFASNAKSFAVVFLFGFTCYHMAFYICFFAFTR